LIYDFHTHTSLSDGGLSPVELIRRALEQDYQETTADCALARAHWPILAIPGVELTHLPPRAIGEAAKRAKELGAWLVVVHGESIIEPVEKGTNKAALQCPYVDILAHPGLISPEEAELAATAGIFLEISARSGHSLTNGHIVQQSRLAGAKLLLNFLLNSDAHDESDLLTVELARRIARGAGLDEKESDEILINNVQAFMSRLPEKG